MRKKEAISDGESSLFDMKDGSKKVQRRKSAVGSGYRGGNWNNDATNARASDRNNAANTNPNRNNNNGGRLAKTSRLWGLQ